MRAFLIKNYKSILGAFMAGCLASACSGGSSGSSNDAVTSDAMINLGVLPNGSNVWVSGNKFSVPHGGYTTATVGLDGGSAGSVQILTFSVNSNDPEVSSLPEVCKIVSGSGNTCQLKFNAKAANAGNYQVTVAYSVSTDASAKAAQREKNMVTLPNSLMYTVLDLPIPSPTLTPAVPIAGNLVISPLTKDSLGIGESTTATIALSGSSGVTQPIEVNLVSSSSSVHLTPEQCKLTTAQDSCVVSLSAVAAGSATVTATANGYAPAFSQTLHISGATESSGSISWNPADLYVAPGGAISTVLTLTGGSATNMQVTIKGGGGLTLSSDQQPSAGLTTNCTLAANSSCVITVHVAATRPTGTVSSLSATASDGTEVANLNVAVRPMSLYTINAGNASLSICDLENDGTPTRCTVERGNDGLQQSTFSLPTGIAFASFYGQTYAYIANYGSGTVAKCILNFDGSLSVCTNQLIDSVGPNSIEGIDIYSVSGNSYAYIANTDGGSQNAVHICKINADDGSFAKCSISTGNGTFKRPDKVSLQVINGVVYAYIANQLTDIAICLVNADGSFANCSASGQAVTRGTGGLAFAQLGNNLFSYMSGLNGNQLLNICSANSSTLTKCTSSYGAFSFDHPWGIANSTFASTPYLYIANSGNDSLSICPLNNDGSLAKCMTSIAPALGGGLSTLTNPVDLAIY